MSNIRKKIIKQVKKQAMPYIKTAFRTGANTVSEQLLSAASDVDQPIDSLFDRLKTAVKSGFLAAGQEIAQGRAVGNNKKEK